MQVLANRNTISRRIEYAELYYLDSLGKEVILCLNDLVPILVVMSNNPQQFEEDDLIQFKWYGLDSITITQNHAEIVAKNCVYNYRPNYLDVITKTEKTSPKQASEGEKQTTHFLYKGSTLVYEKRRGGTSLLRFVSYLNDGIFKFPSVLPTVISRIRVRVILFSNYIEIFQQSKRIKNITITKDISKSNSDYENFHTEGMNKTYQETFKAQRGQGLAKNWILNAISKLYRGESEIIKVTMDAIDENDEEITINTEKMTKHTFKEVNVDSHGIIVSSEMFRILAGL